MWKCEKVENSVQTHAVDRWTTHVATAVSPATPEGACTPVKPTGRSQGAGSDTERVLERTGLSDFALWRLLRDAPVFLFGRFESTAVPY